MCARGVGGFAGLAAAAPPPLLRSRRGGVHSRATPLVGGNALSDARLHAAGFLVPVRAAPPWLCVCVLLASCLCALCFAGVYCVGAC